MAALEDELRDRTVREPLTNLLTLGAFEQRLDEETERARRHGRLLSVAVVDVDGFRELNARHGRLVGDGVLKAVSRALTKGTRATDVVARASADEFLVMLPETDGLESQLCLDRILLELEQGAVGPVESIAVSIGLAQYERPMSSEKLMAFAGSALDTARASGGARSEVHLVGGVRGSAEATAHQDAVAGLAVALLERDRYTGEHSEFVVDLAARVARSLGLDEEEVSRVRTAALLHDIGKVGVPDSVLHKDGPLSDAEWMLMREHPAIGERVLRAIPGLGGVARIVRHEHERFDGGGYPDGLSGEQIPIGSRIILACDAYHAMTSDRPYRAAMPHSDAIRELAKSAGTQFDPQVTEMLIGCLYGQRQSGLIVAV
jgi:diguanylate cyclase (GGDEF)-like protein/putative nucleotidyltransferase with HDIG domain